MKAGISLPDHYNASRIATVVALPITSNTALARHPGNVFIPAQASGLPRDSVDAGLRRVMGV